MVMVEIGLYTSVVNFSTSQCGGMQMSFIISTMHGYIKLWQIASLKLIT